MLAFIAALGATAASASKEGVDFFGSTSGSGTLGGQFNSPRDSAVNSTGNGPANTGDIYVVDDANHRIQRIDEDGNFISAWGADVIQAGKPGDLVGTNPFEICTVAADCKAGVASAGNGTTSGNGVLNSPQSIAVDGDTGNVFVSDRSNRRINVYDGVGNFIASFGFNVDATEPATTYEVCPATNVCKIGVAGAGIGQIASASAGTLGITVSPPDGNAATGMVFLADSGNRRVNTYELSGASLASFGSSANFGSEQPRKIAVDSRGIVYASDSTNAAEIDRYDSQGANGGGVVFLPPISASINEAQTVTFTGLQGGIGGSEFTLTCPNGVSTGPIPYTFQAVFFDDNLRQGRNAGIDPPPDDGLDATCGAANVSVTVPGPDPPTTATISFQGSYAETNVPTTICTVTRGSGSCSVTAETNGVPAALRTGATFGLAIDPDTDGGGLDEDILQVLRDPPAGSTVVQQFGPVNDPGLISAPLDSDDQHGAGADLLNVQGVGLDGSSGRLFVSSVGNASGLGFGHRVFVLDDLPTPAVTLDPVTTKTDTTATFSGTIDPSGARFKCRFEYSTDEINWTEVDDPQCAGLDLDGGSQAVSEAITNLEPNTHYFVRLAATATFEPGFVSRSATVAFDTDAVPPVIADVGAVQVADKSARLVATIDPRKSPTTYFFEYGATPAFGASTGPVDIGGGNKPVTVSQVVDGLTPDTTYYFRAVAANLVDTATGDTESLHTRSKPFPLADPGDCPNQKLRIEQSSTHLPDCFAYEMVSPPDKNQGGVDQYFWETPVMGHSRDGNAAAFCTNALFGDPPAQNKLFCAPYVSRRTASGWETTSPFPRYCLEDRNGFLAGQGVHLNPYFDRVVVEQPESRACPIPPIDPTAPDQALNLYRQDLTTDPFQLELIAPAPVEKNAANLSGVIIGGSDDFSRIFYVSYKANQTDPPDSPDPGDFMKIYEWEQEGAGACTAAGGCIRLVSKDPSGAPFATASSVPTAELTAATVPISSTVSRDGARIYFQNVVDGGSCISAACRLYMREGAATTFEVSAPECAVPADCGPNGSPDTFVWSNPSGDVALFLSSDKLTDDSSATGPKLYRWERNAAVGNRLTDLSVDTEPADGIVPDVLGVIGGSDDGSTVYFVADENQLAVGAPTESDVPMKLYRWRWNGGSPTLEFLAPYLSRGIGCDAGFCTNVTTLANDPNTIPERYDRVTGDGRYLMITTMLPLDAVGDRDSDDDVYRWDEQGGWECVSCQTPGAASGGNVNSIMTVCCDVIATAANPTHEISDDGQRIFFTSREALVPQDTNGELGCPLVRDTNSTGNLYACQDVYEWHDGTVSLISSGTGSDGSVLMGASPSGARVFFYTRDRLVGWDTDEATDIYTARGGGGFPEPSPVPPPCEGDACRGSGTVPPSTAGAGTAVFQGPGNESTKAARCGKGKARRGKRCLSKRAIARRHCRKLHGNAKRRCIRRRRVKSSFQLGGYHRLPANQERRTGR